ncbi:c-type cytochrome [Roseomonas sp. GC11]|uniref:c-type cytochrome n=1 Tax=Roseomonas sp. GC11 TaxID=2950546 RepID=UPI00210A44C2|nr:c-type cytochrome [Roseomonas sp. GC11]MCQ4159590.1 c-type cytochrome [Roseomonas sp. GC11]
MTTPCRTAAALLLLAMPAAAQSVQAQSVQAQSTQAQNADPANGQAVAARWCANCHITAPGSTRAADAAPTFASIAARPGITAAGLDAFLQAPHPIMPEQPLTRQDRADVIAYLLGLSSN